MVRFKFVLSLVAVCCVSGLFPAPVQAAAPRWSHAVVDLSDQHVRVYDTTGMIVRDWPVSTGALKTPTPVGVFRVTTKSVSTFVRDDPSVTMRHMVRFRGSIGFHSIPRRNGKPMWSPLGVKPVSHGCVRLADANAKELYARLAVGALVTVQL